MLPHAPHEVCFLRAFPSPGLHTLPGSASPAHALPLPVPPDSSPPLEGYDRSWLGGNKAQMHGLFGGVSRETPQPQVW